MFGTEVGYSDDDFDEAAARVESDRPPVASGESPAAADESDNWDSDSGAGSVAKAAAPAPAAAKPGGRASRSIPLWAIG